MSISIEFVTQRHIMIRCYLLPFSATDISWLACYMTKHLLLFFKYDVWLGQMWSARQQTNSPLCWTCQHLGLITSFVFFSLVWFLSLPLETTLSRSRAAISAAAHYRSPVSLCLLISLLYIADFSVSSLFRRYFVKFGIPVGFVLFSFFLFCPVVFRLPVCPPKLSGLGQLSWF